VTLAAGTRLGPYEILAPIGAGGMGEVYRARDTRLGRTVAIKVLPPDVDQDPDRRRRFHQEAVAARALNHPNLLVVHDVGVENGRPFLVTELLHGHTLRALLETGAIAPDRAARYAAHLLDGLAAAHAEGIVHRDVKPENIFITDDDTAKMLDFGLARVPDFLSRGDNSVATTTTPGTLLGSVGYMAPEQVTGAPVDQRADLFALGVVLYEMLTGRVPFRGASPVETLNEIVTKDPAWPPDLAAPLRAILERALQKNPARRFQSAADFAFALRMPAGLSPPVPSRRVPAWLLGAAAIAAVSVAAGTLVGRRLAVPGEPPRATQQRLTFQTGRVWAARFVPGSDTIVYAASWNGLPVRLFTARTGLPSPTPVEVPPGDLVGITAGGEVAMLLGPRWLQGMEPSTGTLARAPLAGGAPRELVERAISADWLPDGNTLAVVRDLGRMRRLEFPAGSGVYETAGWLDWVRVSRDGTRVAFADHPLRTDDLGDLAVADRAGHVTRLATNQSAVRGIAWSPDDREVWNSHEGLVEAFALDGTRRIVYRDSRSIVLQDVAPDGRLLLVVNQTRMALGGRLAGDTTERDLTWFDYSVARDITPDGRAMLFFEAGEVAPTDYLIGLWRAGNAAPSNLGVGRPTSLTSDGTFALAIRMRGQVGLRVLPTGAGETREIDFPSLAAIHWATWMPGGRTFVLSANEPGRGSRLYLADLSGRVIRGIGPEGTLYQANAISPDGSRIAARDPQGRITIYQVSDGAAETAHGALDGELPLGWTADGTAVFVLEPSVPAKVTRLNPVTGGRAAWRELMPSDPAGVVRISPVLITPDGNAYAYTYGRFLSTLYAIMPAAR